MRQLAFTASLALLLGLAGCVGETSNKVWLELTPIGRLSHQVYADVILTFHNDSEKEIAIYYWSQSESVAASMNNFLFFDIEKTDGTDLIFKPGGAIPKAPHAKDRLVIEPGGKYAEKINLARFYVEPDRVGKDTEQPWQLWPVRIWAQGQYQVQCTYKYEQDSSWTGGEGLWEGKLTSNKIMLNVRSHSIPWGVFEPPQGWNGDSATP